MIKNLQSLGGLRLNVKRSTALYSSLFLLLSGVGMAQYKIDPLFETMLQDQNSTKRQEMPGNGLIQESELAVSSIIAPDGSVKELYHAIIYTENPQALKNAGYLVQTEHKGFVTALLSSDDINSLRDNNTVSSVMSPKIDRIKNQDNVITSGANLLHNGTLNNMSYTGKGVLVGIFDTGIDFTHPDFIDPVNKTKSRIYKIWDQTLTANASEAPPAGFSFGVEYNQAQINDEIDGSPANFVRQLDINGHGTHVAGTAAGNGSALEGTPHKGMAPEATLVIVKGGDGGFPTTNTIAAMEYFKKVSAELNQPIVVNMSIGGQGSPHDGKAAHELVINEFTQSGPGRVAVISAGNDGDGNIHQRLELTPSEKKTFEIEIDGYRENMTSSLFSFIGFAKGDENQTNIRAKLTMPDGNIYTQEAGSQGTYYIKNDKGTNVAKFDLYNFVDSASKKRFIQLVASRLSAVSFKGTYNLEIENLSTDPLTFDGWLASTNYNLHDITLPKGDNNYTVGSPGTADEAITVANYVASNAFAVNSAVASMNGTYSAPYKINSLNSSSSKGPRADEALKPDITAGGTFVISAKPKNTNDPYIIDGKYYSQMTGTSMSSPAVAGGVALLLQANNTITAKDVKKRLTDNATKDNFTTNQYTNEFGYGKMNIYRAVNQEINKTNGNASCPLSSNVILSNDIVDYMFGKDHGVTLLNYTTSKVAVKLTSNVTGRLGSALVFLGDYNKHPEAVVPLMIEVRKVDENGNVGELLGTKTVANVKTLEQSGWNAINLSDLNIPVTAGQDFYLTLSALAGNLTLVSDTKDITNRTYTAKPGEDYKLNGNYNAKVRALVYENEVGVKQLATASKESKLAVSLGDNYFINGCEMITKVEGSGNSPVKGSVTAKAWVDATLKDFVGRRVEVKADDNNTTATGKVTLYFTQADFDKFNETATVKLPQSATDTENKKNIIVHYYAGTSADNSGSPESYSSPVVNTAITADKAVWNDSYKYWEVTVDAIGFGGYLLSTNKTLATADNTLNQLAIYPNPVQNELNVQLPSNIKEAQLRLVDVTGRTVLTGKVTNSSSKLNVQSLSKGVYIMEISTAQGTTTKKVIKN